MKDLISRIQDPGISRQIEFLIRLVIACILGYLVGYERKNRDKSAGMRTHAIVAMGAALMMMLSKYAFFDIAKYDASRVAAQIVSGIGFLGAGIIFVENHTVSGLTTAAGIWATSGIGMAVGAGMYCLGIGSAVILIAVQVLLHRIHFLSAEPLRGSLNLIVCPDDYEAVIAELKDSFKIDKIKISNLHIQKKKETIKLEYTLLYPAGYDKMKLISSWAKDRRVASISG